jgi:ferredoxin/flavodoxin---NADP+ reductase
VYIDNNLPVPAAGNHEVLQVRFLTDTTFVLRFTRMSLKFSAGQHLIVGLKGEMDMREYSVYSGEGDDYLEILVKEVKDGNVSLKLSGCKPGQVLDVNGPFGTFGIEPFDLYKKKHVFIATGTGISPFHSLVRSNPDIDYTLIHGVRFADEAYEKNDFAPERYTLCTSKEKTSGRKGRVTGFVSDFRVTPEMLFYLCGNGGMIYEVYHILRDKGIAPERIISERYF